VCANMATSDGGGGLVIYRTSTNDFFAFREFVLDSDTHLPAPPRPRWSGSQYICAFQTFLRVIQSRRPWTRVGGVSFKRTMLNNGGVSKKAVFARTSLIEMTPNGD